MSDAPDKRRRGRPRIDPHRLQEEVPPEQRGYVAIRMRADAVELLDAWRDSHGLPSRHAAVAELVARARALELVREYVSPNIVDQALRQARESVSRQHNL